MPIGKAIKREARIAFSRKAQPVWFRVLKWAIAVAVGLYLWRTPYFWACILGAFGLALTGHFFWRWKTRGWTQAWGGWDDLAAANRN
jgi:hypothetical protein